MANDARALATFAAFAAASFRDRLAYRADAAIGVAGAAAKIFLAGVLWTAVYSGRSEIAGMSYPSMLAYYVLAMVLAQADRSNEYVWEFAAEIRGGDFAKYMARPVSPLAAFLAVSAGRSLVHAAVALAAALAVGTGCALLAPGLVAAPSPLGLALALPVAALGLLSLALLNFLTACLAFRFQDITAFHLVKEVLVEFLSGAVLPLAVLPGAVRSVLVWTPFPSMVSAPVDLALGRGAEDLPRTLAVAAAWAAALLMAAEAAYRASARRYEGAGA